jgi:hypothetical protein
MNKFYTRLLAGLGLGRQTGPAAAGTSTPVSIARGGSALLLALATTLGAQAQQRALPTFFQTDGAARAAAATSPLAAALHRSRPLTLDVANLRSALAAAPQETQPGTSPVVLALPMPDGSTSRFAVRETSVMAPALAAQFPTIKTYSGFGLDDASASVRLDLTPQGFHAQVLSASTGTVYIDPVSPADSQHYLSFYRKDMNRAAAGPVADCGFAATKAELAAAAQRQTTAAKSTAARSSGTQLRTYRLAGSPAPANMHLTKGGTVAGAQAGIVTTMNRVVGVYEKELAVRLVLVPNNTSVVYTTAATDPATRTPTPAPC